MSVRKQLEKGARLLTGPLLNLLLPAALGAVFGYGVAVFQQNQAAGAKREVLFHILREELKAIPADVPPYDVKKAIYRDPIRPAVLPLLLDGQSLDYPEHGRLLHALLDLHIAISKYNDFVAVTNSAQATTPVPDSVHRQWYETMKEPTD